MMKRLVRIHTARQRAETVLRERNIRKLPVDPIAIAQEAGVIVRAKPNKVHGVSGMLLRHGDTFGILYATHIRNEGFQRFSISHELGHFFLDGHIDHVLPQGVDTHTSKVGFRSTNIYEREADAFSAGLLMPSFLCQQLLVKTDPGLSAIEAMAAACNTSLTSAALRYCEIANEVVAVIMSTRGVINYCFISNSMASIPKLTRLSKGSPVPRKSATHEYANLPTPGSRSRHKKNRCNLQDWFGGNRSLRATEEVVHFRRYGKVLTILTVESNLAETHQVGNDMVNSMATSM